jgi:hypothetical protein
MGKYWRMIGHYNGEAQTYEALAGAFQASPYTHDESARLVGIRAIVSAEAATSLTEGVQFRLSCAGWKPNVMNVACAGNGLRTVPCDAQAVYDFDVDQPIAPGVPVAIEGRHNVATAVTTNIFLMGCFVS